MVITPRCDQNYPWFNRVKNKVEILFALSVEQAQIKLSTTNEDICAIVIAENGDPIFLSNIWMRFEELRKIFKGPIIIVSPTKRIRKNFLEDDCDHGCTPANFSKKLSEILGL